MNPHGFKLNNLEDNYSNQATTDSAVQATTDTAVNGGTNSVKNIFRSHARELAVLLVIIGLVFSDLVLIGRTNVLADKEREPLTAAVIISDPPPPAPPPPVIPVDPYADLILEARAAIVLDLNTDEVLFEKDSHLKLPLASITKLMTALLADELLTPATIITVDDEAIKADGDSGLLAGERFFRKKLSDFSLIVSSNDAAHALATAGGNTLVPGAGVSAFVSAMNTRAREIGLYDTDFYNPTGLDESDTESGGLGTADDVAKLLNHIINHNPDLVEVTNKEQLQIANVDGGVHKVHNTNNAVINIPGLIASKTGFTELAGGNLAIVYDVGLGHLIAIVVLGSSLDGRFSDVETLVQLTNKQFIVN